MLVVQGPPNLGKSCIAIMALKLAGVERTASFAVSRLGERFDSSKFIGANLLLGSEVKPDFLSQKSADLLLSLCGKDPVPVDIKFEVKVPLLMGDKSILLTLNPVLRAELTDMSLGAVEERLLLLQPDGEGYSRAERDSDFTEEVFRDPEEASGLLNLAIAGIRQILRAGQGRNGSWERSEAQMARVLTLTSNADSPRKWAEECICLESDGDGITTGEAWGAYFRWCKREGVPNWAEYRFRKVVRVLFEELFGKTDSHDLRRGDNQPKGWRGLGYRHAEDIAAAKAEREAVSIKKFAAAA
jgi:hypothetical protein